MSITNLEIRQTAVMRKATGDYLDTKTNKYKSGKFWEVKIQAKEDGLTVDIAVIRRAGSISKAAIIYHIQNNFGMDTAIFERLA